MTINRISFALCLLASVTPTSLWAAQSLSGLWDASVVVNGVTIPFRLELKEKAGKVCGAFLNGDDRLPSTAGAFENNALRLDFAHYATRIEAKLEGGKLTGIYNRGPKPSYPFAAARYVPSPLTAGEVPKIAGSWEIAAKNSKGVDNSWRFFVRQSGPAVTASILRIDGDTGALDGTYRDGKFVLSHFSGARPMLLEIRLTPDDKLDILQNGKDRRTGIRANVARQSGVPEPPDPSRYTTVKDPTQPLRFKAADLSGKLVAESDTRFRGKVLLVNVSGSWCPNCHDEAPFLVELYKKFRSRGLEIVTLSFEEPEQLKDPARLRAFIKQYGFEHTVLLGGEPDQVHEVLPQAQNLATWPATFFVGRDGLVKSVHAGFASRATGDEHYRLKAEITRTIEKLLAENVSMLR